MYSKEELSKRFGRNYNSEHYVKQFEDTIMPLDKQTPKHLTFFLIALKHFDAEQKYLRIPFYKFKPLYPKEKGEVEFFLYFLAFINDCFTKVYKRYEGNIGGSPLVVLKDYKFEECCLVFRFTDKVHKLLSSPEIYYAVSNKVEELVESMTKIPK